MPRENIFKYCNLSFLRLFGCICISVVFMQYYVDGLQKYQLVQERAVVKYLDTKYISDVHVFTARRRRSEPYKTNVTFTTHQVFSNNVTVKISYTLESGNTVELVVRACDIVDLTWIVEFIKKYSNLTVCPMPPGRYGYYNVEIPPQNFPLPIPTLKKGDTTKLNIKAILTRSKQLIFDMYGTVRVK